MKREKFSLREINLKDERFRISYYFGLERLVASLREVGLLNPPLVTQREGRFIIVSGWKRVMACLSLSLSLIPVHIVPGEDELKTFLLAFYENLATREFSLIEKAEILARLKKFGEDEKRIVRQYLPLLEIPQTLSHFDSYLAFSKFESELKKIIHQRNFPFPLAKLFTEFSFSERKRLLPLVSDLSQNKVMEFLESLKEVSRRDEHPVRKILASGEIKDILGSPRLSAFQRADKIRLVLRKKRYPILSSWEKSFNSLQKKLRWPREIALNPSPFFEEKRLSVTFNFESQQEFRASLLRLEELASRREFSDLFKFNSHR